MGPFLLSLLLFGLLNTKLQSQNKYIELASEYLWEVLLAFLIVFLLFLAFLLVTNTDVNLIDTIYCQGFDAQVSDTIQSTNINSPDNTPNIKSNSPNTTSNTNSSKLEHDSDKYYHVRKDSIDKADEFISKRGGN